MLENLTRRLCVSRGLALSPLVAAAKPLRLHPDLLGSASVGRHEQERRACSRT